jgi:hypothetical protein
VDNQEGLGEGEACVTEEECKGRKGNLAQLHNLFCIFTVTQEIRHWKATKNLLFFKEVTARRSTAYL